MNNQPQETKNLARLLISCPDKTGIISQVSTFLFQQGANIMDSDQHTTEEGQFFWRLEFEFGHDSLRKLTEEFSYIAKTASMKWTMKLSSERKRIALFVTKEDHCLLELLYEWQAGDLQADICAIVSNHQSLKLYADQVHIPFYYIPVAKDTKWECEQEQLAILRENNIDTIVLAKYMQILSPTFVAQFPNQIINIHHSFLPAFVGARPYEQAFHRGVKLIGATSHYVTNDLDEGPIIEQGVDRVTHKHSVAQLKRIGKNIERTVLAKAVKWHVEDRVIVHGNKTIVFT
ncbi:formyltetrahydrofolate deformylase [Bacillus sp. HMF5848]|uniref:formyltetrahydrofolate deformylase n=1 Tax=Bacillus sp. HMF5848 TaxID=2495421 RepID=UPI0021AD926C|nr:formyltetrahydrofolate deformylase [Bacillus sp. HMF5848]